MLSHEIGTSPPRAEAGARETLQPHGPGSLQNGICMMVDGFVNVYRPVTAENAEVSPTGEHVESDAPLQAESIPDKGPMRSLYHGNEGPFCDRSWPIDEPDEDIPRGDSSEENPWVDTATDEVNRTWVATDYLERDIQNVAIIHKRFVDHSTCDSFVRDYGKKGTIEPGISPIIEQLPREEANRLIKELVMKCSEFTEDELKQRPDYRDTLVIVMRHVSTIVLEHSSDIDTVNELIKTQAFTLYGNRSQKHELLEKATSLYGAGPDEATAFTTYAKEAFSKPGSDSARGLVELGKERATGILSTLLRLDRKAVDLNKVPPRLSELCASIQLRENPILLQKAVESGGVESRAFESFRRALKAELYNVDEKSAQSLYDELGETRTADVISTLVHLDTEGFKAINPERLSPVFVVLCARMQIRENLRLFIKHHGSEIIRAANERRASHSPAETRQTADNWQRLQDNQGEVRELLPV